MADPLNPLADNSQPAAAPDLSAAPSTPLDPLGSSAFTPLHGAGWHQWNAYTDGRDVYGTGVATTFGPTWDGQRWAHDPQDSGYGWSDPNDPNDPGPEIRGDQYQISLPTGRVPGTYGSPFPQVPMGSQIEVRNPTNGQSVMATLVDEGPNSVDGDTPHTAMTDLTWATKRAIGMNPDENAQVQLRIPGAAGALTAANYHSAPADPTSIDPADAGVVTQIQQALNAGDEATAQQLSFQLKSGALQPLAQDLRGYADRYSNTGDPNAPSLTPADRAQLQSFAHANMANAIEVARRMSAALQSAPAPTGATGAAVTGPTGPLPQGAPVGATVPSPSSAPATQPNPPAGPYSPLADYVRSMAAAPGPYAGQQATTQAEIDRLTQLAKARGDMDSAGAWQPPKQSDFWQGSDPNDPFGELSRPYQPPPMPSRQQIPYPQRQAPQVSPVASALALLAGIASPLHAGAIQADVLNSGINSANQRYQDAQGQFHYAVDQANQAYQDQMAGRQDTIRTAMANLAAERQAQADYYRQMEQQAEEQANLGAEQSLSTALGDLNTRDQQAQQAQGLYNLGAQNINANQAAQAQAAADAERRHEFNLQVGEQSAHDRAMESAAASRANSYAGYNDWRMQGPYPGQAAADRLKWLEAGGPLYDPFGNPTGYFASNFHNGWPQQTGGAAAKPDQPFIPASPGDPDPQGSVLWAGYNAAHTAYQNALPKAEAWVQKAWQTGDIGGHPHVGPIPKAVNDYQLSQVPELKEALESLRRYDDPKTGYLTLWRNARVAQLGHLTDSTGLYHTAPPQGQVPLSNPAGPGFALRPIGGAAPQTPPYPPAPSVLPANTSHAPTQPKKPAKRSQFPTVASADGSPAVTIR